MATLGGTKKQYTRSSSARERLQQTTFLETGLFCSSLKQGSTNRSHQIRLNTTNPSFSRQKRQGVSEFSEAAEQRNLRRELSYFFRPSQHYVSLNSLVTITPSDDLGKAFYGEKMEGSCCGDCLLEVAALSAGKQTIINNFDRVSGSTTTLAGAC